MKNKINYLLWVLVLGAFIAIGFWILEPNKVFDVKPTKIKATNISEHEAFEHTIHDMLHHNKKVWSNIQTLCANNSEIFFWYSQEACSTCTDSALTYLYVYAKSVKNAKRIVIITPETDKKQIEYFSRRYDNLLKFVDSKGVWDKYLSKFNTITAIFFVVDSKLNITDPYIFEIDNEKENQLYFKKIGILP